MLWRGYEFVEGRHMKKNESRRACGEPHRGIAAAQ
jgi:hypothetical protein